MAKDTATAQKSSVGRRRRRLRVLGLILQSLLLAVALVGIYGFSKLDMIHFDELDPIRVNKLTPETEERLKGFMTIALFGSDNRTQGDYGEGSRSDSIMVAVINNDTKEVKIVSVYRDTYLDVNGTLRKCNAAYSFGGVQGAIQMLNDNLDLNIQDYVAVDFKALADVVDVLGGLDFVIDDDEAYHMNNSYIHFVEENVGRTSSEVHGSPEPQHFDGIQVVSYCRVRYTAGNDFRRAERQRMVIQLIVDKIKHMNILQANDVLNAVFPEISTNLNLGDILGLASHMMDYSIVDTHGFPFAMRSGTLGSAGSVVVPCTLATNVADLHAYLYGTEGYIPSEEVLALSSRIVNNSGFNESSALDYGY